jgi:hypothetical protein
MTMVLEALKNPMPMIGGNPDWWPGCNRQCAKEKDYIATVLEKQSGAPFRLWFAGPRAG